MKSSRVIVVNLTLHLIAGNDLLIFVEYSDLPSTTPAGVDYLSGDEDAMVM
jgi:hypothetical protein